MLTFYERTSKIIFLFASTTGQSAEENNPHLLFYLTLVFESYFLELKLNFILFTLSLPLKLNVLTQKSPLFLFLRIFMS